MEKKERRSYVRQNSPFYIRYKLLTPAEYEQARCSGSGIFVPEKKGLMFERSDVDDSDNGLTGSPGLMAFLLHLDKKLDWILSILSKEEAEKELPDLGIGIDISGSGMKINVDRPLERGQVMRAHFILSQFPLVIVDLFGTVIETRTRHKESRILYEVGVEFIDLDPNEREKIITWVFQKQREIIRSKNRRKIGDA